MKTGPPSASEKSEVVRENGLPVPLRSVWKLDRNLVALILTAVCVTAPLAYFGFRPIYLADVSLISDSESGAQLSSKSAFTRVDGDGVAFFDFRAVVPGTTSKVLFLEIRPAAVPTFYRQGDGFRVVNGISSGVGQLGSKQSPLHQDERYSFRFVDASGQLLIDGKILVNVHAIAGISQLAILLIGFFASILQIVVTLWPRRAR